MTLHFDYLLSQYDSGRITRRELLGALSALILVAPAATQNTPAVASVQQLNHVTIFVKDVEKSVSFYQSLFAMPVLTPQSPGVNLNAGSGFLGVYPAGDRATGVNHFCFGLKDFDADSLLKRLATHGVNGNIRLRGETKELYFTDPDNIRVQLQDISYNGGIGVLGNRKPT